MDAVFLKLLNMSIAAGWLILAIIVLRLVLNKAPKWVRCALWGMVGLRLVLPFSIESTLSLIPSAETISPGIGYEQTPVITSGIPALNQALNPIISETLSPAVGASANPLQIWTTVAGYVWLAGIAAMLLYTAISYLRLRRKVDTAVLLQGNIWQSENVKSPFILGLLRPRIYLPFNMTDDNMANVLSHENAHLKRRDHLVKPLAFLLLTVYWFNPLVWLAYVLLCRDIELACDERVVKDLSERERRDYGEALLSCSVSRTGIAACPLAFSEVGVKERIKTVLNYKKPAFWIIIAAAVACIAVAVCFLTNPKLEFPFGRDYFVERVDYNAPMYSFWYTAETAPHYRLTADMQLLVSEDHSDNWSNAGVFKEEDILSSSFDEYFRDYVPYFAWQNDNSDEKLRLNNKQTWQLDVADSENNVFYCLLLQANGDLYLAVGHDTESTYAGQEIYPLVRWVFKLTTDDTASDVFAE